MKKCTVNVSRATLRLGLVAAIGATLALIVAPAAGTGPISVGRASAHSSQAFNAIAYARSVSLKYLSAHTTYSGPTSGPKAKPGVRVAIVSCSQVTTGCHRPTQAAYNAAKTIGWKPTIFDGQGEPSVQLRAVETAVSAHYQAIILMLTDPINVSAGLKAAKAAHIPVITLGEPNYTKIRATTYKWIPDVSHDWYQSGVALGEYMVWKSNGKANVLMMDGADTVVVQKGQFAGSYSVLANKRLCPNCKVNVQKFTVATLTTVPPQEATAAVQGNSQLNWLWCYDFCLYQAITKLRAAGLVRSGLQAAGFDCNAENLNLMRTGVVQSVCAADARDWEAWATIDEANRLVQGQPPVAENPPFRLYDRSTLNQLTSQDMSQGWQGGFSFRAQFKRIWGVK